MKYAKSTSIWRKAGLLWIVSAVVSLYTTFVLQNLWNWFVTNAFNLSAISFWGMYGIVLIFGMLAEQRSKSTTEEHRLNVLMIGLDACIPEEKKEAVKSQLEEQDRHVWVDAGFEVAARIALSTFTLGLGWAVHTFLI